MRIRTKVTAGLVATALLVGGGVAVANAASNDKPPQTPAWVDPKTGKVDPTKMPNEVPVVGPDGKTLKDDKGQEIKSKVDKTPPAPPAQSGPSGPPVSVEEQKVDAHRP